MKQELGKGASFRSKQELREFVWGYMEAHDLVEFPRPCYGRVPNFKGASIAAENLKGLKEWEEAASIFSAPDSSLHPARCEALKEGKTLLAAAPRVKGFYIVKDIPPELASSASTIKGILGYGEPVELKEGLFKIGLYITGAVAVDSLGNRVGKGTGFGDREDEILSQNKLIDEKTPRVAIVHESQVFDDFSHLMGERDRKVTITVTPQRVFKVK